MQIVNNFKLHLVNPFRDSANALRSIITVNFLWYSAIRRMSNLINWNFNVSYAIHESTMSPPPWCLCSSLIQSKDLELPFWWLGIINLCKAQKLSINPRRLLAYCALPWKGRPAVTVALTKDQSSITVCWEVVSVLRGNEAFPSLEPMLTSIPQFAIPPVLQVWNGCIV